MGLNHTSIPNSTDVWWEMSEYGDTYPYKPKPNCKYNKKKVFSIHFFIYICRLPFRSKLFDDDIFQ